VVHDGDRWWRVRVGVALIALVLVAVALVPFRSHVLNTNLALVLVVAVLGAAVVGGRIAGVVGALSAALSYDFLFTVPYGSFKIEHGDDIETTVLLAVIGLIAGELVERARRNEAAAIARRRDLERIHRRADASSSRAPRSSPSYSTSRCAGMFPSRHPRRSRSSPTTRSAFRVTSTVTRHAPLWPCRCVPTDRTSVTSCWSSRRSRSASVPRSTRSTPPSPSRTSSAWRCSGTGGLEPWSLIRGISGRMRHH
jgi:hypothetical protein